MIELPLVNVVMATYNGGKYIENQIKSILNQDYPNFKLYIRDDGSTDDTVEIINRLAAENNKIVFLESNENLGVPKSFYAILEQCEIADFYAFADQDDYWNENKLSLAVDMLKKENQSIPLMYCSSFGYYNSDMEFVREFALPEEVNLYNSIYYTPALGFTLVFNETLRKIGLRGCDALNGKEFGELHDRRFIRVASTMGKVLCDKSISAKHIRHEEAVTSGDNSNLDLFKEWYKNEVSGDEMLLQKRGIKNFLDEYRDDLTEEQVSALELFGSDGRQLKKLFYNHRLRVRLSGEILLRILFLIRKI